MLLDYGIIFFISSNFVGEFHSKQASSEKKGGKGLKAKGKEEESHNCSERRRRRLLSTLGGVESLISSGVLSLTKVASCGLGEGRGEGTHLHGRRDAAACKPSLASKSVRGEGWQLRLGLTRLQWRRREIKERGGKEAKMEENGVGFLLCCKKPPPLSLSRADVVCMGEFRYLVSFHLLCPSFEACQSRQTSAGANMRGLHVFSWDMG